MSYFVLFCWLLICKRFNYLGYLLCFTCNVYVDSVGEVSSWNGLHYFIVTLLEPSI